MDYVKIGGRVFDVLVIEISETFTILYSENTGRTISEGAKMTLDPLGTFFNHKVTFARKQGKETEYDELFDFLSKPRTDGVEVDIAHNQETLKYKAYISTGTRAVKKIDKQKNKVYWDILSVDIVAMEAQIRP